MSRKSKVERRQSCRYQARPVPIVLGWWTADQYQTVKGVLLDISLDGACVCVVSAPPDGVVFLCMETDSPEWLEALIVGRETMSRGSGFQIRLRLRESCRSLGSDNGNYVSFVPIGGPFAV